ncbi:sesquiterpene cyclase [Tanacetum coccineum]
MSIFLVCSASFSPSDCLTSSHGRISSVDQEIVRNTVKFPRSIWGDQFLTYHEPKKDLIIEKQHFEEVEEMRKKLLNAAFSEPKQHTKLIQLIDSVQRLGVSYHFEQEIEEALQHVYATHDIEVLELKDLDFSNKLPHVRDRLVEIYFWILGVYFEPQHSRSRMFLAKTSMWLVVLDDTYDNYGTYEELEIFTEAVQRWSLSCLDSLPEYMKLIYQELINLYHEMEESVGKEGKSYQLLYAKEMVKEGCRNLLVEAKWLKEGYVPTLEEHMSVSCVTSGYAVMIANSYVGRENMVTEESFKWVAKFPPLVNATCLILRLMDDIAGYKEEQERDHVVSSIECYINETGASEEDAIKFLSKKVEDAWKVINKECLRPTEIPMSLTIPPLNLARVSDILYKTHDAYNYAGEELISYIKSLLVHPLV